MMINAIRLMKFPQLLKKLGPSKCVLRTFLSPAYSCNEVWQSRLNSPLFEKINLDELYYDLDQKYQRTKTLSFIDVDVFVNAVEDEILGDEMLDLVHKLRLTSETSNSLPSMSYAVIKYLLKNNKIEELHTVLDDRLNYGIFLNTHLTNLLLDHFWKVQDFVSGTRIASHLMLQEDSEHQISWNLGLLHCYNCLMKNGEWSYPLGPKEPEEEVKVRVKYIRNAYDDNHFDLKDSKKIIGKTLMHLTEGKNDSLNNSFFILGACLYGKIDEVEIKLAGIKRDNIALIKEIIDLVPQDNEMKDKILVAKTISEDVNSTLNLFIEKAINKSSETDIAEQCVLFKEWEQKRLDCLKEKQAILDKIERIKKVEALQKEMQEKETKLWFFENEENIELAIEEKAQMETVEGAENAANKGNNVNVEEEYIPPSIRK